MNYAPGVAYHGDEYIAQGNQALGKVLASLLAYGMQRSSEAEQLRTKAKTMAGPEPVGSDGPGGTGGGPQGADDGGGFSPVTGRTAGAPAAAPGEEDTSGGLSPDQVAKGKQAEAIRSVVRAYVPKMTDLHMGLKAMSHDQLEGMMQGIASNSAMQEQAAKIGQMKALTDRYNAIAQQKAQQDTEDAAYGKAWQAATSLPDDATLKQQMRAASAVPGYGGRIADRLAKSLKDYNDPTSGSKNFFDKGSEARPVKGTKYLQVPLGPNTSQLVYNGDDINEGKAIHDDDGNMIATAVADPKGNLHLVPNKGSAKFAPARNAETGEVIPDQYVGPQGQKLDARSLIAKQFGTPGGGMSTNAPAAGTIMMKDKNGNVVKAPAARKAELLGKGYTLQ